VYQSELVRVRKLWKDSPAKFGSGYTFALLNTVSVYLISFVFFFHPHNNICRMFSCCLYYIIVAGGFQNVQVTNDNQLATEVGEGCEEYVTTFE
jgi:hypothetical protein